MELLTNTLIIYIPLLIITLFFAKKRNVIASNLLYISLATIIANLLLKEYFRIDIGQVSQGLQLSRYKFPSLSVQLATTFWFYLLANYKKTSIYVASGFIVIYVASHKLATHQHSLLDVFGGFLFGLLVVVAFRYLRKGSKNKWTRLAVNERFPNPLTPLFQDVIVEVYTKAARKALRKLELKSKNFVPAYKIFNGYIYNNFDLKKISKLKLAKLVINLYPKAQKTERKFYKEVLPDDKEFFNRLDKIRLKKFSNKQLWNYFQNINRNFESRMAYETEVAYFLESIMKMLKILTKLVMGRESKKYPYLQAVKYMGEYESTQVDKELGSLVKSARRLNLTEVFKSNEPEEILSILKKDKSKLEFYQKFKHFIKKYHFRVTNYEFIASTWGETPEVIVEIIKNYLVGGIDIEDKIKSEREKNKLILTKIEKVFATSEIKSFLLKDKFFKWLEIAERYNLLKEARYNSRMLYFFWLRSVLLQFGENLVGSEAIEQKRDIFFLRKNELRDLVNKKSLAKFSSTKLKLNIKRRKRKKDAQHQLNPPFEIFEGEEIEWERTIDYTKELVGTVASVGKVTGVCKIINGTEEFGKLRKGDILVAKTTNPAWTPLFALAGGVVTETGGILSHAAIVSREYGIPAIVNVENATQTLRDGDAVEVDADKCVVRKLK